MISDPAIPILALMVTSHDVLRLAVAASLFGAVATGVIALFGQKGKTELTPERRVALATGVEDRHTVFEMPSLQPIMWLLLVTARRIGLRGLKKRLGATLVAAGSPNFYTPDEYLAVALLWGVALHVAVFFGYVLIYRKAGYLYPVIAFAVGVAAAIYHLVGKAAKRIREISRRIPYTLDLIALAMGAGATFTEAVQTVVREDREHPFNVELNTVLAEMELGTTRQQALRNLSDRVPLENLRSIIAAVIQAEALGTPLADVLKQQADLLRLQRSVRAEKLAAAASVRILLPGLLIMISVVLAVFGPFIIQAIRGELW
ncbi:MAG TPA: type II secretion system F family protein [Phycisphaerae bacterium]|nr:type II secretion system F family protein [Phycisphaerae bacterium]